LATLATWGAFVGIGIRSDERVFAERTFEGLHERAFDVKRFHERTFGRTDV
jgi:hypothetical protein